jgi:hypothetical protein
MGIQPFSEPKMAWNVQFSKELRVCNGLVRKDDALDKSGLYTNDAEIKRSSKLIYFADRESN